MLSNSKIARVKQLLETDGWRPYVWIAKRAGVSDTSVSAIASGALDYRPVKQGERKPSGMERCPGCRTMGSVPCQVCRTRTSRAETPNDSATGEGVQFVGADETDETWEPTNELPGSDGKMEVMRLRAEKGFPVAHPGDAEGPGARVAVQRVTCNMDRRKKLAV